MQLKSIICISLVTICATLSSHGAKPAWLEPDSAYAISYRLHRDFPYDINDIKRLVPELSEQEINDFIEKGYIESYMFGDSMYFHKKAPRNYKLLAPQFSDFNGRGSTAKKSRHEIVNGILKASPGDGTVTNRQLVTFKFTIDVPTVDAIKGDTLTVWMPVPMTTTRQPEVKILSTTPKQYVISKNGQSVHNTICFRLPVAADTTRFEYIGQFETGAQYFSPEYIRQHLQPYDTSSEIYKKYTAFEEPHIVELPEARSIVGNENDPFRCSEIIYDYIIKNFPWAGAREYSTIPCIPRYVLDSRHGDCGQVSLLYISFMRSLGIPARWESGWMLHPGEKNLHDWAEVYFEGVGWVPVDPSFGRYTNADNKAAVNFYSTGMDQWRFAANTGVNGEFFPSKRHIRSETVDSQMGEVETSGGNLFYPGWNQHLEIINIEPIE